MFLTPILPITVAFAAGIAFRPYWFLTLEETCAALLALVALACALGYFRKSWLALIVAWGAFGITGVTFSIFEQSPLPPTHLKTQVARRTIDITKPLRVSGWVRTPTQARPGNYIFDLAAEHVEQEGARLPAEGNIRVYYYPRKQSEPPLSLRYGTRVEISVSDLRAPRNYANPGMFDYAASMRRRGISYTALIRDRQKDVVEHPGFSGTRTQSLILRLRESMLGSIENILPGKPIEQSILKAMLLGDDNWLNERTEDAFQRSGTYHVLVISGWNVAVFAGPLLLLLTQLRLANWLSSLLVFLTVTSFALIAQWEIPIVRASTMFLVYLVARLFFRHRILTNSLGLAALLLLAIHPSDLYDWGFQLSFLAVLTLSAIALPSVEWKLAPSRHATGSLFDPGQDTRHARTQIQLRADLRMLYSYLCPSNSKNPEGELPSQKVWRVGAWSIFTVAEAIAFTALMQIGFALVSAHYFHRLTWSGILGNLLILPIASGIVLLGMLVIPLVLIFPFFGYALGPILGLLCLALVSIAQFASELSWLNLRVPTPALWVSVAFVIISIVVATLVARRSRWAPVTGLALVLICLMLSVPTRQEACRRGVLEVTALDVGQGDALLVCFPQGSTMLVDAGGTIPIPGSPVRRLDIGETVVSPYLWERGISRIDYVVLSHDHFDHMGGLEAVFENFRVGEFWMGPDAETRKMDWLRGLARRAGAEVIWPVRADGQWGSRRIDGVEVTVLSPPPSWRSAKVSNNDSIVMRLSYGNRSVLLAGDIEASMERLLAMSAATMKSDVLKVPHHGSRTSSTEEFLAKVAPAVSIISVGAYRRFGHPNAEVLQRLSAGNRLLYTTPHSGTISVRTDGNKLEVETYSDSASGPPET